MKKYLVIFSLVSLLVACTTEVDLDLPETEEKIVVEGYVETGEAPYVILTRSIPYFTEVTEDDLANLLVTDADQVVVKNDKGLVDTLTFKTSLTYPQFYYQADNPSIFGEERTSYTLEVIADGKTLTATTYIPEIVALDSTWYETEVGDSLGVIYGNLTDPDSLGNYYQWSAMRLGKDFRFVKPLGSVIDDRLFNGESLPFFNYRGQDPLNNQDTTGFNNPESIRFRTGDVVLVKFSSMSFETFDFFSTKEADQASGGPFAAPISTVSNVQGEGGLGNFNGFASFIDTVYCTVD